MSALRSRTARCRSLRFSGWIGSAGWFGNVPSSSPYEHGERERQTLEHRGHDEPAHAVGGVGDDLQRLQRRRVDERAHVLAERLEQVDVLDLARDLAPRRDARRDHLLDLLQAGLLADRRRAGPAELDAVVLRRVVTRGEHRAGRVELAGREVDEVGRAQPDVGDVGAGERRAFDERGRERLRRRPHVVADDEVLRAGEVREGVADPAGERLVDLVGIDAADVVGLEDGVERHAVLLPTSRAADPASEPDHGSAGTGAFGRAAHPSDRTRIGGGPRGSSGRRPGLVVDRRRGASSSDPSSPSGCRRRDVAAGRRRPPRSAGRRSTGRAARARPRRRP